MDGNYRRQFDFAEQSPVYAVVTTIAAIEDTDPMDMEPLATVVDPKKLEALVSPSNGGQADGCVWFTYRGYQVVVRSNGELTVDLDSCRNAEEATGN